MADAAVNLIYSVLHVRPEPPRSKAADDMDALCEATSLHTETCTDVYRALARLCQDEARTTRTAIVCVDGMGTTELEFFSLVARHRRDVEVHVYGEKPSAPRVAKAVELGATGQATEDTLRKLATVAKLSGGELIVPDAGPDVAVPETVIGATPAPEAREHQPPSAADTDNAPDDVSEEPDEVPPLDDDSPSVPVRVPWLRYGERPVRKGPGHREPLPQQPGTAEPTRPPSSPHEPLLTEAELNALIGDDIAPIAPEEHDVGDDSDRDDGGGVQ